MAKKTVQYDRYRPHARVQEDGSIFNRFTGEYEFPPSRTKQSHLKECDINNIIKQFSVTGQITHVSAKAQLGAYQDLPDQLDYQEAQNTVIAAERSFMTLPAKLRERFENEPSQFLAFLGDPANREEAVKLGLVNAPPRAENPPAEPAPKTEGAS